MARHATAGRHQLERIRWDRFSDPLGDSWVGHARDGRSPELQVAWAAGLAYLLRCRNINSVALTETLEGLQGSVPERDFAGLDCTAWAYELTTPDEPYADRGTHPSGVGVDRYRHLDDLSPEGRRVLNQALGLHFLGLLDPGLWGIRGFGQGSARWLVASGGEMTPHGTMLHLTVGRDTDGADFVVDLEQHISESGWRPGLHVAGRRIPLTEGTSALGELGLRLQPEGLRWDAETHELGAWLQLGVSQRIAPDWSIEGALGARNRVWVRTLPDLDGGLYSHVSVVWHLD